MQLSRIFTQQEKGKTQVTDSNILVEHANAFINAGFAVLPLHRPVDSKSGLICSCGKSNCNPAKHPVGRLAPNGLKDASKDKAVISDWFKTPWNIGIVTGKISGIIALDIDPRHNGDESLARLEAEHGALLPTWRFRTGGGGEHILFRHPGGEVPNSAADIGVGIDVRGDGGYIVAPPSMHISGSFYSFSDQHHPADLDLAEPPDWLLERIRNHSPIVAPSANRSPSEASPIALKGSIPEGERNQAIARLTGCLLARRVHPHLTLELVLAFNARNCSPPLPEDEVLRTVASITRRDIARRAARGYGEAAHG
jgi:putative DNA primase/helicase